MTSFVDKSMFEGNIVVIGGSYVKNGTPIARTGRDETAPFVRRSKNSI